MSSSKILLWVLSICILYANVELHHPPPGPSLHIEKEDIDYNHEKDGTARIVHDNHGTRGLFTQNDRTQYGQVNTKLHSNDKGKGTFYHAQGLTDSDSRVKAFENNEKRKATFEAEKRDTEDFDVTQYKFKGKDGTKIKFKEIKESENLSTKYKSTVVEKPVRPHCGHPDHSDSCEGNHPPRTIDKTIVIHSLPGHKASDWVVKKECYTDEYGRPRITLNIEPSSSYDSRSSSDHGSSGSDSGDTSSHSDSSSDKSSSDSDVSDQNTSSQEDSSDSDDSSGTDDRHEGKHHPSTTVRLDEGSKTLVHEKFKKYTKTKDGPRDHHHTKPTDSENTSSSSDSSDAEDSSDSGYSGDTSRNGDSSSDKNGSDSDVSDQSTSSHDDNSDSDDSSGSDVRHEGKHHPSTTVRLDEGSKTLVHEKFKKYTKTKDGPRDHHHTKPTDSENTSSSSDSSDAEDSSDSGYSGDTSRNGDSSSDKNGSDSDVSDQSTSSHDDNSDSDDSSGSDVKHEGKHHPSTTVRLDEGSKTLVHEKFKKYTKTKDGPKDHHHTKPTDSENSSGHGHSSDSDDSSGSDDRHEGKHHPSTTVRLDEGSKTLVHEKFKKYTKTKDGPRDHHHTKPTDSENTSSSSDSSDAEDSSDSGYSGDTSRNGDSSSDKNGSDSDVSDQSTSSHDDNSDSDDSSGSDVRHEGKHHPSTTVRLDEGSKTLVHEKFKKYTKTKDGPKDHHHTKPTDSENSSGHGHSSDSDDSSGSDDRHEGKHHPSTTVRLDEGSKTLVHEKFKKYTKTKDGPRDHHHTKPTDSENTSSSSDSSDAEDSSDSGYSGDTSRNGDSSSDKNGSDSDVSDKSTSSHDDNSDSDDSSGSDVRHEGKHHPSTTVRLDEGSKTLVHEKFKKYTKTKDGPRDHHHTKPTDSENTSSSSDSSDAEDSSDSGYSGDTSRNGDSSSDKNGSDSDVSDQSTSSHDDNSDSDDSSGSDVRHEGKHHPSTTVRLDEGSKTLVHEKFKKYTKTKDGPKDHHHTKPTDSENSSGHGHSSDSDDSSGSDDRHEGKHHPSTTVRLDEGSKTLVHEKFKKYTKTKDGPRDHHHTKPTDSENTSSSSDSSDAEDSSDSGYSGDTSRNGDSSSDKNGSDSDVSDKSTSSHDDNSDSDDSSGSDVRHEGKHHPSTTVRLDEGSKTLVHEKFKKYTKTKDGPKDHHHTKPTDSENSSGHGHSSDSDDSSGSDDRHEGKHHPSTTVRLDEGSKTLVHEKFKKYTKTKDGPRDHHHTKPTDSENTSSSSDSSDAEDSSDSGYSGDTSRNGDSSSDKNGSDSDVSDKSTSSHDDNSDSDDSSGSDVRHEGKHHPSTTVRLDEGSKTLVHEKFKKYTKTKDGPKDHHHTKPTDSENSSGHGHSSDSDDSSGSDDRHEGKHHPSTTVRLDEGSKTLVHEKFKKYTKTKDGPRDHHHTKPTDSENTSSSSDSSDAEDSSDSGYSGDTSRNGDSSSDKNGSDSDVSDKSTSSHDDNSDSDDSSGSDVRHEGKHHPSTTVRLDEGSKTLVHEKFKKYTKTKDGPKDHHHTKPTDSENSSGHGHSSDSDDSSGSDDRHEGKHHPSTTVRLDEGSKTLVHEKFKKYTKTKDGPRDHHHTKPTDSENTSSSSDSSDAEDSSDSGYSGDTSRNGDSSSDKNGSDSDVSDQSTSSHDDNSDSDDSSGSDENGSSSSQDDDDSYQKPVRVRTGHYSGIFKGRGRNLKIYFRNKCHGPWCFCFRRLKDIPKWLRERMYIRKP